MTHGIVNLGNVTYGALPDLRPGGAIPRMEVQSGIRRAYASDGYYQPVLVPLVLSGAYPRIVAERPDHCVSDRDMRAALRDLLFVVEPAFSVVPVFVEGVAFPTLAFHEFVESLLLWAVIVGVDVEAEGTVDVVDRCMFEIPEECRDLAAALLARDHAGVFRMLAKHFRDPVFTLMRQQVGPGRAALFLAEAKRPAIVESIAAEHWTNDLPIAGGQAA